MALFALESVRRTLREEGMKLLGRPAPSFFDIEEMRIVGLKIYRVEVDLCNTIVFIVQRLEMDTVLFLLQLQQESFI
jgi:hypothetical protein